MSNDEMTEVLEIQGDEYQLRRRLPWMEQQRIDALAFRMFVEGKAFTETDDIADIEELGIRMDPANHNLARLRARLVNVKRRDILGLPPAHVAILVERIEALEEEEKAEIEALQAGNPTATP